MIGLDTRIYDLLRQYPQTTSLFIQYRMACIGCPMGIFDTIKDAALYHHIHPQTFFEKVQAIIQQCDTTPPHSM